MAVYIKVTATATIKLQDPYTQEDIDKAKENLVFTSPDELVEENYTFEVTDADSWNTPQNVLPILWQFNEQSNTSQNCTRITAEPV